MNKLMPYFRLMKKSIILMIVITLSIAITHDGKEILTGFKHSVFENGYLIFKSEIYSTTALLIFIYGIYLSYIKFNVAINIKADRKSYIKASIITMIGMGIVFSIFTVLWSLILKFVVEYVSGKNALVLGDSAYFVNTFTDIINSSLEMGTTVLYAFSDLSIRRFIMDILGQLLTLFAFSSIFNTDLIMNYIVINLVDILRFIINVNIHLIIKLLTIVISLICSVLLLKNAPIKEYAHNLI